MRGSNKERAFRARATLERYWKESKNSDPFEGNEQTALTDLLADILHYIVRGPDGLDLGDAERMARIHYDAESAEEAGEVGG
jgi:hypothetical protein